MSTSRVRKERVNFIAKKTFSKPHRVSFTTKSGDKVRFTATKKVTRPVKVSFHRTIKRK